MQKRRLGSILIAALIAANLALWAIFPPLDDGRANFTNQLIGETLSTSALILMSCGILLTTRPRTLEPLFGGLDKMYLVHRTLAVLAMLLLLGHFFLMAATSEGFNLGPSLGKIALIGLLVSVVLALAKRIPFIGGYLRLPYHRWRLVHRFTGLFFIIGILHSLRIENVMQLSPPVNLYVRALTFAGVALYIYKELLEPLVKRGLTYRVDGVNRLSGTVVEVSLAAAGRRLNHRAGQFLFVRFPTTGSLREAHPFTISSSPGEDNLRLTVKASGDFTQELFDILQEGTEARLEGGYGMFDFRTGGEQQVWVAGGIGITPFLSWLRDLDGSAGQRIDLYYSTRTPDEALFREEIEAAGAKYSTFRAHFIHTNADGHLSAQKVALSSGPVAGKDIYLCGPYPMIEALKAQFIQQGVPARKIHYEEFSFR